MRVLRQNWKPNWDAFHAACVDDTPIPALIDVLVCLKWNESDVWVWSGRMETVRKQTEQWLCHNILAHVNWSNQNQLKAMSPEDRARLVMVFDDRDRVVNMWRRNGVVCAQVAPGDF